MRRIKGLLYYGFFLIGGSMGPFFYSLTHGATLGSIFCVIFIFVIATGIIAIVNGMIK